jgi:exopolysaccharide biosynthesis polyprenyl glycosylphosphotransferase
MIKARALAAPHPVRAQASAHAALINLYKFLDIAIALGAILAAFVISNLDLIPSDAAGFLALRITIKNLLLLVLYALGWSSICRRVDLYPQSRLNRTTILRIVAVCSFGSVLAMVFPVTSRAGTFHSGTLALAWVLSIVLMTLVRAVLGSLVVSSAPGRKQVLIVGTGARALEFYREMRRKAEADYQLLGFVDSRGARPSSPEIRERMLGDLSQLETLLVNHVVDEVLITLPVKSCYTQIQHTIHTCERVGVESKYLADIFKPSLSRASHEHLEGFPMTSMKLVQDDGRLLVKRAIDITGATVGLLALSPLMLLIAAAIRLTSQGPVIFGQERYGRNKRRFRMYKFRTMVSNAEALQEDLEHRNELAGPAFKIKDDPRVTRIGRFLRRTSLDELPQLFNVLRGEMSLVGPRPLPQRDVSRFEEGWLMRRFCVVPGLTGLWQINGRSNTSFDKWVEHDLNYIDKWSLTLDLKIMAQTIPAVVKGVGAV